MYKQISSHFFKNRITHKLITNESYMYNFLTVRKQVININ